MNQTTPKNPEALRLDLIRWLDSRDMEHDHDQETLDEADAAFEEALIREGVLPPDYPCGGVAVLSPIRWRGRLCGVSVVLEDGTIVRLSSIDRRLTISVE